MFLVSIDPGLRATGIACFRDGQLSAAWLARNPFKATRGPEAWERMADAVRAGLLTDGNTIDVLALEYPQVYRFGGARPADLIELAGVVGAVAGKVRANRRIGYLPREWKSNVDADVMLRRIESRLDEKELATIQPCAASLRHNIIDSIGVGLHYLGRL